MKTLTEFLESEEAKQYYDGWYAARVITKNGKQEEYFVEAAKNLDSLMQSLKKKGISPTVDDPNDTIGFGYIYNPNGFYL